MEREAREQLDTNKAMALLASLMTRCRWSVQLLDEVPTRHLAKTVLSGGAGPVRTCSHCRPSPSASRTRCSALALPADPAN